MDEIEKYAFDRRNDCRLSKRSESSADSISFKLHRVEEESFSIEKSEERKENDPDVNFKLLSDFVKDPQNYDNNLLRNELQLLAQELCYYQDKLIDDSQDFGLSFIEFVHFLYKLDKVKDLPDLMDSKLKKFKNELENSEIDCFKAYETVEKLVVLLSRFLVKLGIFDIHNYGYRFKGRSLTINFFNMGEINKYALSIDVLWMSLAINHLPFKNYVGNLLLNYSKILKNVFKKIFKFIYSSSQVESEEFVDFSQVNFEIVPIFFRLFKKKTDPSVQRFYELLCELDKSYRCFERALLEETLKMV